ncbi:hypothetical protein GALMADRAFT_1298296 [Galerina marginata CBS 339.88]|uniref:Uncharacterized protein n=1 Tax=Galerina marginata (strain CBS 339.88) TaxID=685588 RepID=A0A067T4J2_GALM3|nr:hypothetical protein GALMADRAFT_1298296 [Galerina marginata CBS 339.88]
MHSSTSGPGSHGGGGGGGGSNIASLLPVSNDRISSLRDSHPRSAKRQRSTLDSMDPGRRSPVSVGMGMGMGGGPGDMMALGGARAPGELYLPDHQAPGQGQGRYGRQIRPSSSGGHGGMPPPHTGPYDPAPMHQHHQHQHQHQHQHPHQHQHQHPHQMGFNPSYAPLFPQGSPPPAFVPLQTDFGPGPGRAGAPTGFPRDMHSHNGTHNGGGGYASNSNPNSNRTRFEPQYDPALYNPNVNVLARAPGFPSHSQSPVPVSVPNQREERGDMFAAFLEADERSRQGQGQGQHQGGGGRAGGPGGLDWPSAGAGAGNNNNNPPSPPRGMARGSSGGMSGGGSGSCFFFCFFLCLFFFFCFLWIMFSVCSRSFSIFILCSFLLRPPFLLRSFLFSILCSRLFVAFRIPFFSLTSPCSRRSSLVLVYFSFLRLRSCCSLDVFPVVTLVITLVVPSLILFLSPFC